MRASCSVQRPSSSISRRCLAFILKWKPHLGQTRKFASKSFRNTMVRQDSHFTHRPSVRTLRSSGGVGCSMDFLSRLNQAIIEIASRRCQLAFGPEKGPRCTRGGGNATLIVYTTLGQNAFGVGVFDFAHFGDQV